MKSLLRARVNRIWSLKHRVKFKTSCILSLTMSCMQGACKGLLARVGNLLAPGGIPKCMVPSA
jgi:hypothetical protein